ncbi:solute carrier family 40 member 2, chloroplastic-like [Carex rostrata]
MAVAFELNKQYHLLLLPLFSLTNRYRSPSLPLSRGSTSTRSRLNDYLISYKCSLRLSHVHCKSHNSIPFLPNSNSNSTSTSNTTSLLNLQHITELEEPAHPHALFVFYLSCFVGNIKENLWNFTWPCAIAMLHPTLMPVACVAFFSKLAIFIGGPLIGNLMDYFPRMHSYNFLNQVKTVAQVISGVMIIHALGAADFCVSSLQTQTWFFVLLLAMSADKLASLALGVSVERDWVVMLAGAKREIALAHANATLSRVDLLCETGGAWLFAVLLSKYDLVTCIKIACGISACTLPLLLVLNKAANHLSLGVLEQSPSRSSPRSCEKSHSSDWFLNPKKIVKDGLMAIKQGWNEYVNMPVLPASVTYVLLCFNIALAPGSLMTTFLTHQAGLNPYMLGLFSGSSALFGILATFVSASLVRRLGIFKAGAVGLLSQALPLITAALIYWTEPMSQGTSLASFLALIVLSRWGQMSYSVIGLQIIQTTVHPSKANLIGTTENSIASLAELVMMGVAMLASDVSHFGLLTVLSVCSVVAATGFYCHWLERTTSII